MWIGPTESAALGITEARARWARGEGATLRHFRALLLGASLLMAAIAAVHLLVGDARSPGAPVWPAVGVAWLALWWIVGFRASGFPFPGEIPGWCALVALGSGVSPAASTGVFFVSLFFRVQYGTLGRAAVVIASYVSAVLAAAWLRQPGSGDSWRHPQLAEIPALAVLGFVFWFVGGMLESRDGAAGPGAADAAAEASACTRAILESAQDPFITMDAAGRICEWNAAAERTFGWSRAEVLGRPLSGTVVPARYAAAHEAGVRAFLASGESRLIGARTEFPAARKDGSEILVQMALTAVRDGGEWRFHSFLYDVTEQRRARAELEESNRRLRTLIEASPIAIVALDKAGRVSTWNPAAERTFGWSAAEALGRPPLFVPRSCGDDHSALLCRVLRGEAINGVLLRRVRKDGREVDVRLSAAPLTDAEGKARGAIALLVDVTEWIRLEAEMRQSQKMEAVGVLAGGIAHDFNNLLTVIQGNTSLLLADHAEDGAPPPEDLVEVSRAAERARALVGQLLALSRKQVLEPRALDLNAVVADTDRLLRRLIPASVELVTVLAPEVPSVRADAGQLQQVLMNLVVNAGDAMPSGGRLVLETDTVVLDEPLRGAGTHVPAGTYASLCVTDSGPGIAPEHLPRIFEPFFTTKPNGKGTGLGLSTVYGIVRQSGGYVRAERPPAGGARFSVYLPAVDEAPAANAPVPASSVEEDGRGRTVLLVEDDAKVRRVTRRILESAGYAVVEAENGEQALRLWTDRVGEIDLLVTDMVMPLLGGRELAARLRAAAPCLPVLFISGYAEQDPAAEAGEPSLFVAKPFLPAELVGAAARLLQGQGSCG